MFANSMATRRMKRNQTKRKGGNWWSRKARDLGIYDAGPSTSLLAREIYAMLDKDGINRDRQSDFNNLMIHHPHVKKGKLLRDLRSEGMTDHQEYDVVYHLDEILPSKRPQLLASFE
jgi:hypothetical protein